MDLIYVLKCRLASCGEPFWSQSSQLDANVGMRSCQFQLMHTFEVRCKQFRSLGSKVLLLVNSCMDPTASTSVEILLTHRCLMMGTQSHTKLEI